MPVDKKFLRMSGTSAPLRHLLAGEEEKSQGRMVSYPASLY